MYGVQGIGGYTEDTPWHVGGVECYELACTQKLKRYHVTVYAKGQILLCTFSQLINSDQNCLFMEEAD